MNQAPSTQPQTYITFKLADELFAIDIKHVREVIEMAPIARVPSAPAHLRGVVNVRGQAVPVVDLRRKFGLPDAPITLQTRIVILDLSVDAESHMLGGLADSVHDVIELAAKDLAPPPRLTTRWRSEIITGVAQRDSGFIMILDVARVFDLDDLTAVERAEAPEAEQATQGA